MGEGVSIRVSIDESNWLVLPPEFPAEDASGAGEWTGLVVDAIRERWAGGFDDDDERAVRAELRAGLDSVRPEDSITLQYWRWSAPLTAVVHLVLGRFDTEGERPAYLLDEGSFAADPAFTIVTAAHLGDGVEVRILSRPDGLAEEVAGLTQLYSSGDRFVAVGVDATVPTLLALMLPDLRDLLDTAVVEDDDGSDPWVRATASEASLPRRGETWTDGSTPSVTAASA